MALDGEALSLSLSLSSRGVPPYIPPMDVTPEAYLPPVPASAAIAESPLDARRRRLREWLPQRLVAMADALEVARGALDGPDPEAALGYLAVLEAELAQALAEHR